MKKVLFLVAIVGLIGSAQAAFSGMFVNADLNNTWAADSGTYPNQADWENSNKDTPNKWCWRPTFGVDDGVNATGVFGSNETFPAQGDSPLLKTTISHDGLVANTEYKVYVVFEDKPDPDDADWHVYAGFASDGTDLAKFEEDNSVAIGLSPGQTTGGRTTYEGYVGTTFTDGSGNLVLYVDDLPNSGSGARAWYDGVVFAAVPEPATMALLAMGSLGLLKRKR